MKELKNFDKATDALAKVFVEKYFGKDYKEDDDYYWIGINDEDREVLSIGDYFFNLDDIVNFIRYKYTEKEMFKYYDYRLDNDTRNKYLTNIKNWKKLKK